MTRNGRSRAAATAGLLLLLAAALLRPATAATSCVAPGGAGGCYNSITAAVGNANPGDTIDVRPGAYSEDVVIGKSVSIVGADPKTTIIDALARNNGFYVDGIDNANLAQVSITGFTVEHAQFEGILVTNASSVTIFNNRVIDNNKALDTTNLTCPGLPSFETAEGEDCGEGIHLSATVSATVADNVVEGNSGGILLSDDTGVAVGNLVTGNLVESNPFDCGITLASHPPAKLTRAKTPFGVFSNTISGNQSIGNGLSLPGAGAGVGIFASVSGAAAYLNVVSSNILNNNGLPGVALHSHVTGQDLNGNVISGNLITGNHADTADAATPGSTGINIFGVSPILGTVIADNSISKESNDIAVNTAGLVDVHVNGLSGSNAGIRNLGSGAVNARLNWWGCAAGPGKTGCSKVAGTGIAFEPFLTVAPLLPGPILAAPSAALP
jgi:parallel beta-helix repeat protein